jgi:hypothetical protein
MFFDGIVQLPPQPPAPAPTRHFLDKYTAQVCAGKGGIWRNTTTFADFLKKGLTPKDNSHIKDIVKEILTYTPHLLAIFAPLYFNTSPWSTPLINLTSVLLNWMIERHLASSQRQAKREAHDLFRGIVVWYELQTIIDKERSIKDDTLYHKDVKELLNRTPGYSQYIPGNNLRLLKKAPYRFNYEFSKEKQAVVSVWINSARVRVHLEDDFSFYEKLKYTVAHTVLPAVIPVLQTYCQEYLTALPYLPSFANFVLSMVDFINKQAQERTKSLAKPVSTEAVNQQIKQILTVLSQAKVRFEQDLSQQYEAKAGN